MSYNKCLGILTALTKEKRELIDKNQYFEPLNKEWLHVFINDFSLDIRQHILLNWQKDLEEKNGKNV